MNIPVTRKVLLEWGGPRVLKEAEALVDSGRVSEAVYDPPVIRGAVLWNNRPLKTAVRILDDGSVENLCPCRDNVERGIICAHVVALGMMLVKRATDPLRDVKHRAEMRHAARMAETDESEYIKRVPEGTPGSVPARLRVILEDNWQDGCRMGSVPVAIEVEYQGRRCPIGDVPAAGLTMAFSRQEDAAVYVLEDISGGPVKNRLDLGLFDFVNLIELHSGRALYRPDGTVITVNNAKLVTFLRMDLDRETGELILMVHTELPFLKEGEFPFYVICEKGGWVYGADHMWSLENILPLPYREIYRKPVTTSRRDVLRFLKMECPMLSKCARIESDISEDLFTVEPGSPKLRLAVKGSPASLAAALYARYGDVELPAGEPHPRDNFAIPDPDDLMKYAVRNLPEEKRALDLLAAAGFREDRAAAGRVEGKCEAEVRHIVGEREVLNFLGRHVPALRRRGWQIALEGRVSQYMDSMDFATPVVRVNDASGGWFDIGFGFEGCEGSSLTHSEVQRALLRGESYVEKNGKRTLIDADAVDSMLRTFSDCATTESDTPGHFRMDGVYSAFVKSSLDALDGVDVESSESWRRTAGQHDRTVQIEDVVLPEPLNGLLRPYQKYGVRWLRFLEKNGFCGLLADEMGLGKTLETLAWLALKRASQGAEGLPALIVCPTSLVENWAEEAARFVPGMRTIALTGPDRREKMALMKETDLAITSYALLRRDIDLYAEREFSAAILDEAQHIKNPSTQNAAAAGKIRARHRLVLTGTPMENTVMDLWSIMDFLMPGYLGARESFREHYEIPLSRGGEQAKETQTRLRRKIHPFLLRRLKTEVARDLPPKIEKIAFCRLTADQQVVYNELLQSSRLRISNMVAKQGYNRSRMEILAVLMRLRQTCCHLDLLKLPGLRPEFPSAKLDLFFELVDEALDGGHRILVFSQFVSMLRIIRGELESRSLAHCYLDGATKDRMKVVHAFNTDRSVPFFLISLKAGGTGLNLTGADMVVHFDPWWNPAVEDQATDRAYRIGQKRTVYSIKLITKNTVEEKVRALQEKKKAMIAATLESDEKVLEQMTWDDIRELLSM